MSDETLRVLIAVAFERYRWAVEESKRAPFSLALDLYAKAALEECVEIIEKRRAAAEKTLAN